MDVFSYVSMVSGFIINTLESQNNLNENNKGSINFDIKPVRNPQGNLYYTVSGVENFKKQKFYCEFPCDNKKEFYEALNTLLVEYFKNSDLLVYTSFSSELGKNSAFSMVTKSCSKVSIGIEDEIDTEMFMEFKSYLDSNLYNKYSDKDDLKDTGHSNFTLKKAKIRL